MKTHWVVLECDNPGCFGEAAIRLLDVLNGVPLGVVQPDPPGTRERYEEEMRRQNESGIS